MWHDIIMNDLPFCCSSSIRASRATRLPDDGAEGWNRTVEAVPTLEPERAVMCQTVVPATQAERQHKAHNLTAGVQTSKREQQ